MVGGLVSDGAVIVVVWLAFSYRTQRWSANELETNSGHVAHARTLVRLVMDRLHIMDVM
jgi:hypothetical protein